MSKLITFVVMLVVGLVAVVAVSPVIVSLIRVAGPLVAVIAAAIVVVRLVWYWTGRGY